MDTAAFFATLDRLLTLEWNSKAPAAEREQFVAVLGRLARAWEPGRAPDDAFWAQEARSLAWAADYAWAGKSRDRAMGENFAWLVAHRLQGRKIVIWAHNNHIIADHRMYLGALDSTVRASVARMSPAQRDSFTYFGDAVRRLFKSDAVMFDQSGREFRFATRAFKTMAFRQLLQVASFEFQIDLGFQ